MPLPLILAIGAIATGALALIFLFATSLLEAPAANQESREAVEMRAIIKRQKKHAAILGVASALLAAAFALAWFGLLP